VANSTRSRLIWLAIGLMPGIAAGEDTGQRDAGESSTESTQDQFSLRASEIWGTRLTVYEDGTSMREVLGSLLVRDDHDVLRPIDPRDQISADGQIYEWAASAWQLDEHDPVTYEVRARRYDGPTPEVGVLTETAPTRVAPDVQTWLDDQVPGELRDVTFRVPGIEALDLPHVPDAGAVALDVWLDATERRVRSIEARRSLVGDELAPILAWLDSFEVEVVETSWAIPSITVRGDAVQIGALIRDGTWQAVGFVEVGNPDGVGGLELRRVTQLKPFIQTQQTGRIGAGPSRVRAATIDIGFDPKHPVWTDDEMPGGSRLLDVLEFDNATGTWIHPDWDDVDADQFGSHGTMVAGQAFGDLTEDQDPNWTVLSDQRERSGLSPETQFVVFNTDWVPLSLADQLLLEDVEIVNRSLSVDLACSPTSWVDDIANILTMNGSFWVTTAGNSIDCDPSGWNICNYMGGGAAGAFTVNGLEVDVVDIDAGPVGDGCHGGDLGGTRSVISMAAIGGRDLEGVPYAQWSSIHSNYVHLYGPNFTSSSLAAPVATGAAADLKDFLYEHNPGIATDPGFIHALMLLMSDGQMGAPNQLNQPDSVAQLSDSFDPVWGAGRLKMRLFTGPGMDAPWHADAQLRFVQHGITSTIPLNDSTGQNLPIPTSADRLYATAWWYEPNVLNGVNNTADITIKTCNTSNGICDTWGGGVQRQRYRRNYVPPNITWEIRLKGEDVPASTDPNYIPTIPARFVYTAWYYEDNARDDANGPEAYIQ
jgi:hypothetical protein